MKIMKGEMVVGVEKKVLGYWGGSAVQGVSC